MHVIAAGAAKRDAGRSLRKYEKCSSKPMRESLALVQVSSCPCHRFAHCFRCAWHSRFMGSTSRWPTVFGNPVAASLLPCSQCLLGPIAFREQAGDPCHGFRMGNNLSFLGYCGFGALSPARSTEGANTKARSQRTISWSLFQ